VDEVVRVDEAETIRTCRHLARRGFLFGGSTGTVVSGALDWLRQNDTGQLTAVAISPDLGERYLETIYSNDWVQEHYGEDVLARDEPEPDPDRVGRPDRARLGPPVGDHAGPVRRRGPGPRRLRIGVERSTAGR
jgi:cysteine synthase A